MMDTVLFVAKAWSAAYRLCNGPKILSSPTNLAPTIVENEVANLNLSAHWSLGNQTSQGQFWMSSEASSFGHICYLEFSLQLTTGSFDHVLTAMNSCRNCHKTGRVK